jgi:predicted RNA binding protein YcfA (HicA-like mRNA interferase family)
MPKIPRDISGRKLAELLGKYGYKITRETGSHLRLESKLGNKSHKITIPDHRPIKIGTLNNILMELANHQKISKEDLTTELFKKRKKR